MPKLSRIARDVRALGTSAPLRAAYEASKRFNGHSLLFREVKGGYRSTPILFGHHVPRDDEARTRCLTDATAILNEGTRVFGRRTATGAAASWAMDPLTERCWPEETPWWQIDIRTDARLSDVKFVWEAGRHRDLVVLARAAVLEPEGPWLSKLEEMLVRWCRECRPERGVNWYSSLELALRAIAWNQILVLVGDQFSTRLRAELDDQLVASARHIMVELPYTMTSMKNNHLLGDGLGLVVLGQMFPDHPSSTRWRTIGDCLMLKQLGRHMRDDGSMIEDSLSYHRFVLEMLIVRVLLGNAPEAVRAAMRAAAEHLQALGVFEGKVPQYGDWDEGRVLTDSAEAGDVAGAAHLALELSGSARPDAAWGRYDELAWYVPRSASIGHDSDSVRSGSWSTGHFSGAAHGPWRVWLKQSLTHSHQHADLSSVWISKDDEWVLQEPGTGTYNGPLHVRDGFRTSAAHPVWRPEGRDLLGPYRAFRWQRATVACGAERLDLDDLSVLCSWHDGFADVGRVMRTVLVDGDGVTVVDWVPAGSQDWTMTVPHGAAAAELSGLEQASTDRGKEEPFLGWHSGTYGSWHASDWGIAKSEGGWFVWGAGRIRSARTSTDETIDLGDLQLAVVNENAHVAVTVSWHEAQHRLEAARA